jgi:hypothetical protein
MEFSLLPYMAAVKVEFDSLTGCQLQVHSYLKKGKKTKDPLGLFTIIENLFRREAKSNTIAVSVAWEAAGKGYDIRTYASVNAKNIFSQDALQAFTDTLNDRHSETLSAVMEPKKTHDKIIAALETLRAGYISSDTVYTIAVEQLQAVFPGTPAERIKEVVDAVNKYSGEFGISTPERMAHFIGQIGAETKGLTALKESNLYSPRTIAKTFPYPKYGHLFEEAFLDTTTYQYSYTPINFDENKCSGKEISRGSATFSYTSVADIRNAYAEVKNDTLVATLNRLS